MFKVGVVVSKRDKEELTRVWFAFPVKKTKWRRRFQKERGGAGNSTNYMSLDIKRQSIHLNGLCIGKADSQIEGTDKYPCLRFRTG